MMTINKQKGITLIGTLLALGVSAAIVGSVLAIYKLAQSNSRVYLAKRDLGVMIHNLHEKKASFQNGSQNGYKNLTNKKVINLGIVPKRKILNKSQNTIKNRLAKGSVQGKIKFGSLNNGKYFTVSYTHLTRAHCIKFADAIKPWADAIQITSSPIAINILNNYHYMYHNQGSMQKHILLNNDVNYNFKNKNLAYYPSNNHNTGQNRYKPQSLVYHPNKNRQGLFRNVYYYGFVLGKYNVRSWKKTRTVTKNGTTYVYYKDKYGNIYREKKTKNAISQQIGVHTRWQAKTSNGSWKGISYAKPLHLGQGGGPNKYGLSWNKLLGNPLPSGWTVTGHQKNIPTTRSKNGLSPTKKHPLGMKPATPSNSSQKNLANRFYHEWVFVKSPSGKKYIFQISQKVSYNNQLGYKTLQPPTKTSYTTLNPTYHTFTTFGTINKNPKIGGSKIKQGIMSWKNGKCNTPPSFKLSNGGCNFSSLPSTSTKPSTTTTTSTSSSSSSSTPISSSSSSSTISPTSSTTITSSPTSSTSSSSSFYSYTSPTTTSPTSSTSTSPTSSTTSSSSSSTSTSSTTSSSSSLIPKSRYSSNSIISAKKAPTYNASKTYTYTNLSNMNRSQIANACSAGNRTVNFIDH